MMKRGEQDNKRPGERKMRPAKERNTPVQTTEDDGGRLDQMFRIAVRDLEMGTYDYSHEWELRGMSLCRWKKKKKWQTVFL